MSIRRRKRRAKARRKKANHGVKPCLHRKRISTSKSGR